MTERLTVVWSEPRTPWPAEKKLARAVLDRLAQAPEVDLAVVPHLYDLAPDGAGVEYLRSLGGPMLVLAWLHPRAAFWLLDAHGVKGRMGSTAFFAEEELPERADTLRMDAAPATGRGAKPSAEQPASQRTIWCIDLREHAEAAPLVAEVGRIVREITGGVLPAAAEAPAADSLLIGKQMRRIAEATCARWYPVVDYSRCANCLECLNFCLFGVFDRGDDDSLVVVLPDACRTGCPACARVCPAGAIMFPMHSDPAIAGDPRAPSQAGPMDLLPLLGLGPQEAGDPGALAAAERGRAVAQSGLSGPQAADSAQAPRAAQPSMAQRQDPAPAAETAPLPDLPRAAHPPGKPERKKDSIAEKLDRLVDELDQLDQPDV